MNMKDHIMDKGSFIAPTKYADAARSVRHVFIRDLILTSYIGVYDHEKNKPQQIRVNVDLSVREDIKSLDDDIDNVVCYEKIVTNIEALAQSGHVHLVETLAENIAEMNLLDQRVLCIRVRVEKLEAIKNTTSVGIEIERYQK